MIKFPGLIATAVGRNARASINFDAKLAQTRELLVQAAAAYQAVEGKSQITQASSLGAEDMVITHVIHSLGLEISIFVLQTGMLHDETLALLADLEAAANLSGNAAVEVYAPVHEAVVSFVKREGKDPMYRSVELRKACCNIRKMEPLQRAGFDSAVLRADQDVAFAQMQFDRYAGYYQGDAIDVTPHFHKAAP